jgi:hypothetical protein
MRGAAVAFVLTLVGCGEPGTPGADGGRVGVVVVTDGGGGDAVTEPDVGGPTTFADTAPPSCSYPQVFCGNTCLDVSGDPMNCGGCNAICPAGNTCNGGLCVPPISTTSL